jgi:L-rhamnose isomerase
MIVSRLAQFGKLGGFHFNDSKYGDDDLDAGSIKPFQLFLVFDVLVDAGLSGMPDFNPAYMLDQSHNVTDPVESLMTSAIEVVRAFVQAHLDDAEASEAPARDLRFRLARAIHSSIGSLGEFARRTCRPHVNQHRQLTVATRADTPEVVSRFRNELAHCTARA